MDDALLAIEVTAITATPSPTCSERAEAKKADRPATTATNTNTEAGDRVRVPNSQLIASVVTLHQRP